MGSLGFVGESCAQRGVPGSSNEVFGKREKVREKKKILVRPQTKMIENCHSATSQL